MRFRILTLWIPCMIAAFFLISCGRNNKSVEQENLDIQTPLSAQTPLVSITPDEQVDQDTNETSINTFLPVSEIHENQSQSTGTDDMKRFDAILENGEPAQFEIDTTTDEVVSFVRLGQSSNAVNVDSDSSLEIANTFLEQHDSSPEALGLQLLGSGLSTDEIGESNYYTYWWVQVDPTSGAFLPNEVRLRVNAETGQVDSYSRMHVDVTTATVPQIGEEQARNIALDALGDLVGAEIATIVLTVSTLPVYEPNGEQALMWQMVIEGTPDETGYVPGAFIVIDAISGEIVHIEPFM